MSSGAPTRRERADVVVISNGHGEDEIAGLIIDRLRSMVPAGTRLIAWPMVGSGERYRFRSIATLGPGARLPAEGFSTVSLGHFLRDMRAGLAGTYLRQLVFAPSLARHARAAIAIGDIVPLTAAGLSGLPTVFLSTAKSAFYGSPTGHNALERVLMRRCRTVFVRDELTAGGLRARGVDAVFAGNPMMDGTAEPAGPALICPGEIGIAVLPGSRADAPANARALLEGLDGAIGRIGDAGALRFLFALAPDTDPAAVTKGGAHGGWSATGGVLTHPTGAEAHLVRDRFAAVLRASTLAIGMAGTANEQAIGVGLPLIALPGHGNQNAAYLRMKKRYFGDAAIASGGDAESLARHLDTLLGSPELRSRMADEGRRRMGPPGGSQRIAEAITSALGLA